ncbi:hypothetical protein RirG_064220 [Rhizophagus irregularis DAOM 197198w]|uniref:Uncharacterized protein n=2 Tax=Rhizophagus irregularis TaxID=588596 RepID=A0A015N1J6_RHIIW|nr:hypothetical protein RirG_064220 [Rhizophagus irregularis DAOM 197198w]
MQVEMDREVADINVGQISNKTNNTSYYHLMEGLKNCLTQNKEIFQVIYDVKNEQKEFYKKTREQLNELLEKVDQFMIPENSYWKNLASKTCKIQLPILGIYPGGIAFQKAFEAMLEQEKPGYIEKHGPQWMHIYEGRIKPLCNDIIKSWRCDKTKDIRAAIFDIFGEDWLVHINTTASADDICSFKQSRKTKKAFECYIYLDCLSNSKEITANTTKQIRLMELCKENDSNTSSNNSGDSESNYDQELEDNQELGDNQELEDNQELGIIKN